MSDTVGRIGWAARSFGCAVRFGRPCSPVAHLRLLWHDFIIHALLNRGGERCQRCGNNYVLWHAPSELWDRVHGSPAGLLCPQCFSREAERFGISVDFAARDRGAPLGHSVAICYRQAMRDALDALRLTEDPHEARDLADTLLVCVLNDVPVTEPDHTDERREG